MASLLLPLSIVVWITGMPAALTAETWFIVAPVGK